MINSTKNKTMKRFLLTISLLVATLNVSAQQFFVTNALPAGAKALVNEACVLNNIQLLSATNAIIRIYDGAITNAVGAYTNYTVFSTNLVTTFITTTGLTNTFTNTVLFTSATAVAAATNNTPPIITLVVPANSITPITFNGPIAFTKNLTLSNDVGIVSCVINFRQP